MLAGAAMALAGPAMADPADWTISPYQAFIGEAQLDIAGMAGGALFTATGAGRDQTVSGVAKLMPRLHRDYDSGLSLGLDGTVTASDPLSRGRYGGDAIEKVYGDLRTGLGRLEIGQTDGGAYDLSVTGPKVDAQVSLDDPQTSFFRSRSNGRAVTDLFTLRTEIGAASNYAKLTYLSPAVFGAQLAFSFTPSEGKDVLPGLHEGPHVPGRQVDIWETALRYSDDIGPVSVSAYGGFAVGRGEHKVGGQEGVSDLGAGLRADYPVDDDVSVSLGGSWRQSNAYAFDINRSYQAGTTRAWHGSASLTDDAFVLGVEYGSGDADGVAGLPHLGLTGYQASLGYVLNANIQATVGWQRLDYGRSAGTFFNGGSRLGLDAGFLHLNLHT